MESAKEYLEKGKGLFAKGDYLGALAQFERCLSLDSSNLLCQSYVALLMATERGQVQKALSVMREIMEKAPNDTEIYLNMGRVCLKAGLKAEAIDAVRKGLGIRVTPRPSIFLSEWE